MASIPYLLLTWNSFGAKSLRYLKISGSRGNSFKGRELRFVNGTSPLLTHSLTHFRHEFDQGCGHTGGINQHVKMSCIEGSTGPPGSACLLHSGKVGLTEQDVSAVSSRPRCHFWQHLLKKCERSRGRERKQVKRLVGNARSKMNVVGVFIRRYKAGQRSRQARGRQKQLNRLERVERPQDFPEMHFAFSSGVDSGQVVLSTQKLVVGYPPSYAGGEPAVLVRVADLELLRNDRVGLVGPNGAGKTTLLRTIIGELPPLRGQVNLGHNVRIGYYSQTHAGLNPDRTVLDEIRRSSTLSEEGARSFLGRFLFTGDDVFKPIGLLSGGERSRVALAKLTLQGSNFLVLDEPTNHLDLPSRQFLEEVLSEFEGTLLFVSHDRYFIDRLATKVWVIEDGILIPYLGNYTEYRTRRRPIVLDVPAPLKNNDRTKAAAASHKIGNKKGAPARIRTLEDVEREIERAEAYIKELEQALAEAALGGDAAQLTQLSADYEQAKGRVDELLAEWEQLVAS